MPRTQPDSPAQFRPVDTRTPLFEPETLPDPPTPVPATVAGAATGMPSAPDPWLALSLPFPPQLVELKPGAVSQEKRRCLALPYVDARHYQARLDAVAGHAGWSVEYRPLSDRAVLCRLTVLGVTREDVGEAENNDPNQATSAAMQAFKRACAAFGLGRYLYTSLSQVWADAEGRGRAWAIKDPAGVVQQMYDSAGIDLSRRRAYLSRIVTLCEALSEEHLIAVGKCAAGK